MKLYESINQGSTYIIAEMSANHAGSLERAKEIILEAKKAGADCVKIQTYTADTITLDCDNEYFHIDDGTWKGQNLYQLYGQAYTPWEWQPELKQLSDEIGIDFFSTPFDHSAVDFLEEMNMECYKIASFELVDIPLIQYVASKQKPIIMSTGMASAEEIQEAVDAIRKYHNEIVLLKCSSAYPAVSSEMNLATMIDMKEKFSCPVGLSDHSMGSLGAVCAVAMGANVIEKHFCISREIDNPDASFSMDVQEFTDMVRDIRLAEQAKGTVFYGCSPKEEANRAFRKSIFVAKDIDQGEILSEENIRVVRPSYGMKPKYYHQVLGTIAAKDLKKGQPLTDEMIEKSYYLRAVSAEDRDLLFQWCNDSVTRANSLNTGEIPYENHCQWFDKKMASKNSYLFICIKEGNPVGQARLEIEQGIGIISYSVAAEYRGQRIGYQMLKLLEQEAVVKEEVTKLHAIVKQGNVISQRCFEKLEYQRKDDGELCYFQKEV